MKIDLTGNPFVDTGILTIQSHLAKEEHREIKEVLNPQQIKQAMESKEGFGRWLAKANRQLKSFYMVVGTNSSLVNPSNNKMMNKTKDYGFLAEEDSGWQTYIEKLEELCNEFLEDSAQDNLDNKILCESCGERPATRVIKSVGRDFFPLAGSIGNDAQALPAASRSPRICPLCLIAVQWLPLGTCVFNRGLACFQFTEPRLSQLVTQSLYDENFKKIQSTPSNKKIPIYNSSESAKSGVRSKSLGTILFEEIRRLKELREFEELPESVTLNIWTFSNSGQSPDCEVFDIPNPSLQFFWEGLKYHAELNKILEREDPKKTFTHLISAIEQRKEYLGFHPQKLKKGETKSEIATVKLFELFQTKVLNRPQIALDGAKLFAKLAHQKLKAEAETDKKRKTFYEQVLKENPRVVKEQNIRIGLRKMLVEFAEKGQIKLEHYVSLFPAANLQDIENLTLEKALQVWQSYKAGETPKGEAIRRTNKGWDLFWFYFHHAENGTLDFDEQKSSKSDLSKEEIAMFTNPKVKEFAKDVFEITLERRGANDKQKGLEWIKKNILDGFSRGKVTVANLKEWFLNLGEKQGKNGYSNEDWDTFCRDEWGNLAVGELLFQTRLELANLHREENENLRSV